MATRHSGPLQFRELTTEGPDGAVEGSQGGTVQPPGAVRHRQLDNNRRLQIVRKDIARIYTIMRERELGSRPETV